MPEKIGLKACLQSGIIWQTPLIVKFLIVVKIAWENAPDRSQRLFISASVLYICTTLEISNVHNAKCYNIQWFQFSGKNRGNFKSRKKFATRHALNQSAKRWFDKEQSNRLFDYVMVQRLNGISRFCVMWCSLGNFFVRFAVSSYESIWNKKRK